MCDVTEIQSPVSGDLVEILYAVSITLITRDKPGQYSLSADKKKKKCGREILQNIRQERW